MGERESNPDILWILSDLTNKVNWDKFYTIRDTEDSFEWYSEWDQLRGKLLPLLPDTPSITKILVPGCGNSGLSQELYDHGYKLITNIDFSQVVVSYMMTRHVREMPVMKWQVGDMTRMKFEDETFDVVLDKGGLDALMEPKGGTKLGNQYLSESSQLRGKVYLSYFGRVACFRYGWKMSIHVIPTKPSDKPAICTFMVIADKEQSPVLHQISSKFDIPSHIRGDQVRGLINALEHENKVRQEYSTGLDIPYSLEDLKSGAKGDLRKLEPGRRAQLTLGEQGTSIFRYVVLP